ncbi:photosystem I P700 apoprotein A1, partial [Tanacetum coccineum]
IWRASGITSELQLYCTAIGGLVFAALMLFAGWFHYHKAAPKLAWFQDVESMLNHHLAGLLGLGSLSWAGHQVHVSLPINQFLNAGVDPKEIPLPHEFILNRDLLAQLYPSFAEGATPFFTLNWSKYSDFLTFRGGLDPVTGGLWLTDTAHHHLAIAILFLIAGHMYRTNWGIGHGLKDILEAHKGPFTGQGHKGLYEILTTSWHAQLSLNLAMLGSLTIIVAHHMYAMPPYPYLATDYGTQLSLFTHHMWIGGFLIVGAAAHAAIFMVRDYDPTTRYNDLLDRVLRHRDAIISHLNWACIFLGFHSFGLYIHNDTMSALGRPQDMFSDTAIQLQPVFAQWIQNTHALAPSATAPGATASTSLTWGGGDLVAVGGKVALLPIPLGTADFLVHHIHAFTIHVTVLILLKGVLFARSSRLIPDKANLGFRFPCDGPGRGGTCQVSAWDHVFLGLFWMYNAISVVIFHFSWKMQSDVWGSISDQGVVTHITGGNFAQSSITINGWLRDFLWAQASQVIQSYGSSLSAYGLFFLGAHFVWAFSLMFLFSGRGYWQELIESIVWAHNKLKVAPATQPRALSIVQGRAVGVTLKNFSKYVTRRRDNQVQLSSANLSFHRKATQLVIRKILNHLFSHNLEQLSFISFQNKIPVFSSQSLKHLMLTQKFSCAHCTLTSTWDLPSLTTLYLEGITLTELLSSSVELISYQPSPFANLKSLKIYPIRKEVHEKATVSIVVENFFLDSSPSATLTMVLREEIRMYKLMEELQGLLNQ